MAGAIRVKGLKQLNTSLGKISKDFRKDVIKRFRDIGAQILPEARAGAPRQTGELARNTRVSSTNRGVAITNRLPQAGVIHYGGTIYPKGAPIHFEPRPFIAEAVDRHTEHITDEVGDLLDRIARQNGFDD